MLYIFQKIYKVIKQLQVLQKIKYGQKVLTK